MSDKPEMTMKEAAFVAICVALSFIALPWLIRFFWWWYSLALDGITC